MRFLIAFLILQTTVQGQCFSGGYSSFGSSYCPPRRIIRSHSYAPVYNDVVVKEVVREVPVLAYPVQQQYAPNPYLMQAQFKQYYLQLQRMQQDLQDAITEGQAFAQFNQQQQTVQQPAPVQQAPPVQQYEQGYQQMPQPYGAYAPQTPQQPQQSYGYAPQGYVQQTPPPQPQQNGGCIPAAELLRMLLAPQPEQQYQQPPPGYQQQQQAEAPAEGYAGVLETRCAGCHSGSNPKGGFDLGRLAQMDFQRRKFAFQRALRGEMPLDANGNPQLLPPEELNALRDEMFTPAEVGTEMQKSAMRRKTASATTAKWAVQKP